MKLLFLAAALSGTMLAGMAATAQPGPGGPGGMLMRADANGDGIITHAEWLAAAATRFERMDANKDGKLSGDELHGRDDGEITKEAYMAKADERFQKLDTNHDGKITKDEIDAMTARFRDGGGRGGHGDMGPPPGAGPDGKGPDGDHGPDGHGPWGKGPHHGMHDMLEKVDTNHDGKISREEMRAAADARFDKLDTNKDGFIDKAEMDAAHDRMKKAFEERRGHMPPPPGAAQKDANQ